MSFPGSKYRQIWTREKTNESVRHDQNAIDAQSRMRSTSNQTNPRQRDRIALTRRRMG